MTLRATNDNKGKQTPTGKTSSPLATATDKNSGKSGGQLRTSTEEADAFSSNRSSLENRLPWLTGLGVSLLSLAVYLFTLSPTVNFIDSGELIAVGAMAGVSHPPGYPLYTLLTIIGAALPFSDRAFGVNLVSALSGAVAVGLFYALVYEIIRYHIQPSMPTAPVEGRAMSNRAARKEARTRAASRQAGAEDLDAGVAPKPRADLYAISVAAGAALLLCASYTFWSWSTQAKMYSLHYVFVVLLLLVALLARRTVRGAGRPGPLWPPRRWPTPARWLVLLAFGAGLAFTNHPMSVILMPSIAILVLWPQRFPQQGVEVRGRPMEPIQQDAPLWRWLLSYIPWLLVAGLSPFLIYLYLPLSAARQPILNWGSPDNWGDFWRHITLWQSRVLLGRTSSDFSAYLGRAANMASVQLGPWLGLPVLALAIAGAVRLARAALPVFAATGLLLALTLYQTFNFQNAEVAAYSVPMYMMVILWASVGLYWLLVSIADYTAPRSAQPTEMQTKQEPQSNPASRPMLLAIVPLALAVLAVFWNVGRTGHANDHLAEAYIQNHFKNFAPNAVVITNNWYLASPSYYMQYVRGERPDVAIIDRKLLQYPFYLDYVRRQYPEVMGTVKDLADPFGDIARRWVDGEQVDSQRLSVLYFDMMKALINRNVEAGRPVYLQWNDPGQEEAFIAQGLSTHPEGMSLRVDAQPFTGPPPDPQFDWRGILTDVVPKEPIALLVIDEYPLALDRLAEFARQNNHPDEAARFAAEAARVRSAIGLSSP